MKWNFGETAKLGKVGQSRAIMQEELMPKGTSKDEYFKIQFQGDDKRSKHL